MRNLTKTFETKAHREVNALAGISLEIAYGEFLAIVGRSGCGKTTLLRTIAGLTLPTSGTVYIDTQLPHLYQAPIGVVFQGAHLLPWLNALDNVLLPIDIQGLPRRTFVAAAQDLLAFVGLEKSATCFPRELSGGMQQRVAICRALIHNPSLLLMDEPFGALDALTREDLGRELIRICSAQKRTVVFVTHSIPEAIRLADRVVVMSPNPGRIADIITIDVPKPHGDDLEFTSVFQGYHRAIHDLIFQAPKRHDVH